MPFPDRHPTTKSSQARPVEKPRKPLGPRIKAEEPNSLAEAWGPCPRNREQGRRRHQTCSRLVPPTPATAVAAAAPAVAASTATRATSATATVLAWFGLVDGEAAAIDL